MLLVISDKTDNHLPFLLPKLEDRGIDYVCLDTADFPDEIDIEVGIDSHGTLRGLVHDRDRSWSLAEITAVWNRRPEPPRVSAAITEPTQRAYAELQSRAVLEGLWWLLDCRWLPARPLIDKRGNNKLVNLARAVGLGFTVAETLMTNRPDAFVEFYERSRGILVAKGFAYTHLERHAEPYAYQVYTNPVRRRDLANVDAIRYAPSIFQRYVNKRVELRVTVVGERVFAAEVDSQASRSTRHDCRHYDDNFVRYRVHPLPADIAARCVRLVRSLELSYGAIDLIVTPEGEYVFLELNANGQWAGIEQRTGLAIADAIIDWLVDPMPAGAPEQEVP